MHENKIQIIDGTEENIGTCIPSLKKKYTWKIKINSKETIIDLIINKLYPRKYLYVNGLLRESIFNFTSFSYYFFLQGNNVQLEYENSSYTMTINKKPLSYYIEKYNKNNDNQDKRPIIDENKNLPLKPQVLNTEEINLNTFNKINEELLEVSAKLKIKKDNINVKSQSEDNSEITKTKKNKNLSHISKSSSPEKIKLEEKKQEADPFLDNIFINDKNCVADVNKIRGKIAFLVNQAENQEKKSEVIINLERIRSKLFWLSNSINNEKILSEILKLNDEINGTFEKLLTTPNPISKDKIEKIETKRDNDDDLCIICLEKKVSHACIPCGHLKYCEKCIQIIVERNECAVCRSKVQSVYKIFI